MADTTGQYIIQLLVQFIRAEVSLIHGPPKDLKAITSALQDIETNLKSADKRAEEDDSVKLWVTRMRELTYEIEDAIEEYQLLQKKDTLGLPTQPLLLRHKYLATTIENICQNVVDVCCAKNDREHQDVQVQRSSPSLIEESELVGAETAKRQIMELIRVHDVAMKRSTVAVTGMRGVGKTSIVGSVYNDPSVRHSFPICAWIDASQPCSSTEIITSIFKQLYDASRNMVNLNQSFALISYRENALAPNYTSSEGDTFLHEPEMVNLDQIRNYLTRKRYLVVLDDVQENNELVNYVKFALPANNEGSKILITTRNENLARVWLDDSYRGLYKLEPLTPQKAWELFCKKTYQSEVNEEWPTELHNLAHGIVDGCEGLPLGILALGRLLSTKQNDQDEWRKVHDNLGLYLEKYAHNRYINHKILIRDFHNLEDYLKPCFLYFGLFPKGYGVKRVRLIRLWMAEGFIRKSVDLTLEEVAEKYLNELINMSMVEVVSKKLDGARRLRVNEFLYEMIVNKLEELNFCKILTTNHTPLARNPRRLSIHKDHGLNSNEVLTSINRCDVSKVHSLIFFEQKIETFPNILTASFMDTVHLLKVLDLCNAPIHDIPDAVGNLLNLHYLSLRYTRVKKLPSSIGNLQNLQTLDLKHSHITELPNEINKLHKLRHLIAYSYWIYDNPKGITMAEGALCNFRELQKLAYLDVARNNKFAKELGSLKQLRKLGIKNLSEGVNANDLCVGIEGMTHLHSLSISATSGSDNNSMDFLEHLKFPHVSLERILLNGQLKSFPDILRLQSLVIVSLRLSRLSNIPIEILGGLLNLLELELAAAYVGDTIEIGNVGFQKLKVLRLYDMPALRSLVIHKLAIPLLEEMHIGNCGQLFIPTSIQFLSKLKKLDFSWMPESFNASIRSGGQYNSIIKHVPNVSITN